MSVVAGSAWRMSLFARSLWLIVALIVASQVANFVVFRELAQRPRLERLADYIRASVDAINLALQRLPPAERAAYVDALNQAGDGLRIVPADAVPPSFSARTSPGIALLLRPLRRMLGAGYRLHWEREGGARMWVEMRLGGRDYWIGFASAGLLPSLRLLLLFGTAISAALALLGAWVIQRTVHRPMRALVAAAEAVGAGRQPGLLPRDAPPEIAQVAHSFGAMAASLEQADRDRAVMLAGISHDLRTPLAKLRLCVEMLPHDADAELVDTMKRSIATADAIVGQFIDFARVGTDEVPETVDLTALVQRAALDAMPADRLQFELPVSCAMQGRPVALRRAVMNLVDNAARHAGGMVGVRLRCVSGGAELAVLDRGPGVAPGDRHRLVQPFIRGDGSKGSGLGLAVADRIARLHGGALELRNREGGGLEARLRLP